MSLYHHKLGRNSQKLFEYINYSLKIVFTNQILIGTDVQNKLRSMTKTGRWHLSAEYKSQHVALLNLTRSSFALH